MGRRGGARRRVPCAPSGQGPIVDGERRTSSRPPAPRTWTCTIKIRDVRTRSRLLDRIRSVAVLLTLPLGSALPVGAQEVALEGSLWTRFETRNIDAGASTRFTWLQTRIGAETTFSPLVRVFAQVQDARRLGEETSTTDGSADRLDLHQGYLELGTPGETPLWLRVGRQEYEVASGRIVGIPIWSPVSRVFDGVRAALPMGERARVEFFGFQIAESTQTVNPADAYLLGAWGTLPLGAATTVHLIGVHDRDNADVETSRTTVLTQVDGRFGPLRYRVEAGSQVGTVEELDVAAGSLLAVYAAVPWAGGRGTVGLGIDRYGGDADPAPGETAGFSDLFGRNHRFLGFADLFSDPRTNLGGRGLIDLDVRGTWNVRPDLQLRADYHRFSLVDGDGYDDARIADEVDLQIWGEILDGLDIRAGGSWVGAADPLIDLGLSAGDQLFGYLQLSAGFWGGTPGGTPR